MADSPEAPSSVNDATDRRDFLAKCGRFAVITPPTVTMLLSTSLTSQAIAKSGGGKGNEPGANPGHGGTPPGHGGTPPGQGDGLAGLLRDLF